MDEEEETMYKNILETNTSLFYKGLKNHENNSVVSPVVLYKLLAVLRHDLRYHKSNNLRSLMSHSDQLSYDKCFGDFVSFLHSLRTDFFLDSKFFIQNNCELQDNWKDLLNKFHYELETGESSVKLINYWIENRTNGLINELISPNTLSDKSNLALLNAAYFKGKWERGFTLETVPAMFKLNDSDCVQIQMMKLTGNINCTFHPDYKIIELPFSSDNDISFFAVLPNKGGKVKQEENIIWNLQHMNNDMAKQDIEVLLPKFKFSQVADCKQLFQNLNVDKEFKEQVNLFGMFKDEELLKYIQFNMKGFLNIDEQGVEVTNCISTAMERTELDEELFDDGLKISEMNIKTTIFNRFAKTLVTSTIQNTNDSAKEAKFSVVLPEAAYITEFIMEMGGKTYKSYIKKREEAKAIYNQALAQGKTAGIVETEVRDSTQFEVSVNLAPQAVAVFLLTYEEMLQRVCDQYELVLNICPGQIVNYLHVEVNINESKPLMFVKTPPLRSGKEIEQTIEKYLIPSSDIKMMNSNTSTVQFNIDKLQQWKIGNYMGTNGFAGQFIVQYDVERSPKDGEILVQDGYFVHFFAPIDLEPLPKHIIFVIDTSGSMNGKKIDQLKDATMAILTNLRERDLISIIEFNNNVTVWDINTEESKTITCRSIPDFEDPFEVFKELSLPSPAVVNDQTVNKAKNVVQKMSCNGGTFIIGGLEVALYILKVEQEKSPEHQAVMVFLTDGEPNVGVQTTSEVVEMVTRLNSFYGKVPIFSLSFGTGADKAFLRVLSLKNFGFSKHIYEASDASLQLQSFYKQISSPLLVNINFNYNGDVTELTKNHFPIYFKGGELVVSGQCKGNSLSSIINGYGPKGLLRLASIVQNPVTSLKKLWAYLTVKQLLEERAVVEDKDELTKRATDLALKYSFVTEVTSLIVVRPEDTCDTSTPSVPEVENDPNDFRAMLKKRKYAKWGKDVQDVEVKLCEDKKFIADHPFLIALMLKKDDRKIFLFGGWVHRPCIGH